MIQASDLRIGNFVNVTHVQFNETEESTIQIDDLVRIFTNIDTYEYHPIDISEKWLLRFCFDCNPSWKGRFDCHYAVLEVGYLFLGATIGFDIVTLFQHEGTSTGLHIRYVHQLQNLYFSLTGKELTYSDVI